MSHLPKNLPTLVFVAVALTLMGGTVMAGSEDLINDGLNFTLSGEGTWPYGTSDYPEYESVTLDAAFYFDVAQTGTVNEIELTFSFDPEFLTLEGVRPASCWGTIMPGDTGLYVMDAGNPTVMKYIISKESTIPMATYSRTVAHLDFHANCAPWIQSLQKEVDFVLGPGVTCLRGGGNVYSVDEATEVQNGSIWTYGSFWMLELAATGISNLELEGVLGTEITVPVYAWTSYKIAGVDLTFSYDVAKLEFVEVPSSTYFSQILADETIPGTVTLDLNTDESYCPRREYTDHEWIFDMTFKVVGDWQGDATVFTDLSGMVYVAQFDGECDQLLHVSETVGARPIMIDAYDAAFSTWFPDGGTLSIDNDLVSVMMQLNGNFPAGGAANSIIANLNVGTLEETGSPVGPDGTYPSPDFGWFGYSGPSGREISLRSVSTTSWGGGDEIDLVKFYLTTPFNFEPPTAFEDRLFPLTYTATFDSDPNADARVTDTTGQVTLESPALTWDAPQVEYLMGEFACEFAYNDAGESVIQDYTVRHSFGLGDFRLKIIVDGPHNMYEVNCESGVEVKDFDAVDHKWVVLGPDATWGDPGPVAVETKIADITYVLSGQSVLAKETVGTPDLPDDPIGYPTGYWIRKVSDISFEEVGDNAYYMADLGDCDQHVVVIENQVKSSIWKNPLDPNDNISMYGTGIPETFELHQNYPNPFNPATEIQFGVPEACRVTLVVYNITGQRVTTLVDDWVEPGYYTVTWNGAGFASGIYMYRFQAGDVVDTRKMVLLK